MTRADGEKEFDCVEEKWKAGRLLQAELEALTPEQRRRFWEESYQRMLKLQDESRAAAGMPAGKVPDKR